MKMIDKSVVKRLAIQCGIQHAIDNSYLNEELEAFAQSIIKAYVSEQPIVAYLNDDNCIPDPCSAEHVQKGQARGEYFEYTIPLYALKGEPE